MLERRRFCDAMSMIRSQSSAFVPTIAVDSKVKTVAWNDKRVKLKIWDTSGQEKYRTITTAYYRDAVGLILVYDITNEETFQAVQDWSTEVKKYSSSNPNVILSWQQV